MRLPKELTTVTTLSKTVALLLFITLPIVAFIFGTNYQKIIDSNQTNIIAPTEIIINPTVQPNNRSKIGCSDIRGQKCPSGYICDTSQFPDASGVCVKVGTTVSEYKCPKTEYVDCMPTVGGTKTGCNPSFLQWAKENCPNFKGVAY